MGFNPSGGKMMQILETAGDAYITQDIAVFNDILKLRRKSKEILEAAEDSAAKLFQDFQKDWAQRFAFC